MILKYLRLRLSDSVVLEQDDDSKKSHHALGLLPEFFLGDVVEILNQDVLDDVGLHPLVDALLDGRREDRQVVTGKLPEIQALVRIDPAEGLIHDERLGWNGELVHRPRL